MASNLPPTVILNNHLQNIGRAQAISYLAIDNGPTVVNRWSITVKIDGRVMGSSSAPRMAAAKEAAARQALAGLGIQ